MFAKNCTIPGPARRNARLLAIAIVVGLAAWPQTAEAWCVYNHTRYVLECEVSGGDWSVLIGPATSSCCHYSNTDCNPGGSQTAPRTLKVSSPDNSALDFLGVVSIQAGGYAEIFEEDHGWPGSPNLYVVGHNADGSVRNVSRNGNGASTRNVRFLVSADCQYDNSDGQSGGDNGRATLTTQRMVQTLLSNPDYRGIVYAGDLTQNTRPNDEFEWYEASFAGNSRYMHDGLGNHDEAEPTSDETTACALGLDACVDPDYLREAIRDRKHETVKTNRGDPHYSWDWHDVHFVQLNLFPGIEAAPEFPDLSPNLSLIFLQTDLLTFAGDSGRPVVLFHHYGFDDFSTNTPGDCNFNGDEETWWTEEQRRAYWNVIAPYNVVAIFTGHLHLGHNSDCPWRIEWTRPTGASGGPDSIPTFVSGAALNGVFLDVEMNAAGQMFVRRTDEFGAIHASGCALMNTSVRIDRGATSFGEGTYVRPYHTVGAALVVPAAVEPSCPADVILDIVAGEYPENLTLDQPMLVRALGGTARIGDD